MKNSVMKIKILGGKCNKRDTDRASWEQCVEVFGLGEPAGVGVSQKWLPLSYSRSGPKLMFRIRRVKGRGIRPIGHHPRED